MSTTNIKELQKKIRSLKEESAALEADCYTILNEPKPDFYNYYIEYKKFQEERAAILKLFKKEDGDILDLYNNYMDGIIKKQKMRQNVLDSLKKNMEVLGFSESEDPTTGAKNSLKVYVFDIKTILKDLKENFLNFTKQSISELHRARLATRKIITFKKNEAQAKIDKLNDCQRKIVEKFGNSKTELEARHNKMLAARKIMNYTVFDDDEPQEDFNIQLTRQTFKQLLPFKERILKFSARMDIMFNKIAIFDLRISKLQKTVDQLRTSKARKNAIRASQLFNKFSSQIVKFTRQEEALDAALKEVESRKKEIMPVIEKEREEAEKSVPGTGKTVRQLRNEIERVIHEIHAETLDKEQYIKTIESSERDFSNVSDALINKLEDELAKKQKN